MDTRTVELWLRMTADALRGSDDAQRALGALGQGPMPPEALTEWMKLWRLGGTPGGGQVSATDVSEFHTMLEDWWRVLGVVPLYRYEEMSKRCDELKRRLEDAERTVRRLRGTLGSGSEQAEAKELLDTWERMTEQTLAAQAGLTRRWLEGWGEEAGTNEQDDNKESEEPGG